MRAARHLLLLALAVLACRTDLPEAWHVVGLRVLTVTLDPPEVAPGQRTHVRLVVADTLGRPQSVRWTVCPPTAGQSTPSHFGCPSPLTLRGEGTDFDIMIPRLPVTVPVIPVALRFGVCAGGTISFDAEEQARCSGTDYREATRTLLVSATDHNANPRIAGVELDGETWREDFVPAIPPCPTHDAGARCQYRVRPAMADDAREAFRSAGADAGVPATEMLSTRFYVTAGQLAGGQRQDPSESVRSTMEMTWTAPVAPGEVTFWFVVDDGRGGLSVAIRKLIVAS